MSTEANKRMAVEFVHASCAHDGPKFDALLHPEATYWVIGKPHLFSYGGEQDRAQICAFMASPSIFVGGAKPTIHTLTAEDDRVAVESEVRGEMADGRVYTNVYHYLLWFRDGKIIRVKEYLDTQSAAEFFSKG
jgi:ketosteroid isomerase-like protein